VKASQPRVNPSRTNFTVAEAVAGQANCRFEGDNRILIADNPAVKYAVPPHPRPLFQKAWLAAESRKNP